MKNTEIRPRVHKKKIMLPPTQVTTAQDRLDELIQEDADILSIRILNEQSWDTQGISQFEVRTYPDGLELVYTHDSAILFCRDINTLFRYRLVRV